MSSGYCWSRIKQTFCCFGFKILKGQQFKGSGQQRSFQNWIRSQSGVGSRICNQKWGIRSQKWVGNQESGQEWGVSGKGQNWRPLLTPHSWPLTLTPVSSLLIPHSWPLSQETESGLKATHLAGKHKLTIAVTRVLPIVPPFLALFVLFFCEGTVFKRWCECEGEKALVLDRMSLQWCEYSKRTSEIPWLWILILMLILAS